MIFPNIVDSRDDAQRVFEASQNPGRWDRRLPAHGFDIHCPHCIAGHHLLKGLRPVGTWPEWHLEADCECGAVLAGANPTRLWADHVREVRA